MRADKPDIDHAVGIVDPHHDAVFVACNIEHRTTVLEDTRATDIPFYVSGLCPVRLPDLTKPGHDGLGRVSHDLATLKKNLDSAERDDPHVVILT